MKTIWRLYAWASMVTGMIVGILRDDWQLSELVNFMAWHMTPFSNTPSIIADVIVFPAALVAWMVPASTGAPLIFGSVFVLGVGVVFLVASAGALFRVCWGAESFWLGSRGAFGDE